MNCEMMIAVFEGSKINPNDPRPSQMKPATRIALFLDDFLSTVFDLSDIFFPPKIFYRPANTTNAFVYGILYCQTSSFQFTI
jgi:hypothetical protein